MHILDDPSDLTDRAQAFLARVGERTEVQHQPTEFMLVPDRHGNTIPAPFELVIRREGFAQKFGGLRYPVRQSVLFPDGLDVRELFWEFTLFDFVRQDHRGWYFDWSGEHVASPVHYLQHTDGRFGVTDSGTFIPVHPTMLSLIEHHALLDKHAEWEPVSLPADAEVDGLRAALPVLPEASGPWARWHADEDTALHENLLWTSTQPRTWRRRVWVRTPEARRGPGGALTA